MKIVWLTFYGFLFCTVLNAQFQIVENRIKTSAVPKDIVDFVTKNYKEYRVKYFEILQEDNNLEYEAVLKQGNKSVYAVFNKDAALLHVDKTIDYKLIPHTIKKEIQNDLNKKFKRFNINNCKHRSLNGMVYYEIRLKANHKRHELLYDEDGQFLSNKQIPEKPLGPIFH